MKNKMCDLKMVRMENNFNEFDNNSDKNNNKRNFHLVIINLIK